MAARDRSPSPSALRNPLYESVTNESEKDRYKKEQDVDKQFTRETEFQADYRAPIPPQYEEAKVIPRKTVRKENEVYAMNDTSRPQSKKNVASKMSDSNNKAATRKYIMFVSLVLLGVAAVVISVLALVLSGLVIGGIVPNTEDEFSSLRRSVSSLKLALSSAASLTCVSASTEMITVTVMPSPTPPPTIPVTSLTSWNLTECRIFHDSCNFTTGCNITAPTPPQFVSSSSTSNRSTITVETVCWVSDYENTAITYFETVGDKFTCVCHSGSGVCNYHQMDCEVSSFDVIRGS